MWLPPLIGPAFSNVGVSTSFSASGDVGLTLRGVLGGVTTVLSDLNSLGGGVILNMTLIFRFRKVPFLTMLTG